MERVRDRVDGSSLRGGGVMRLWISEHGEEAFYEQDVPGCCRWHVRGAVNAFDCLTCWTKWQVALPAEPEECAFIERMEKERKGAA